MGWTYLGKPDDWSHAIASHHHRYGQGAGGHVCCNHQGLETDFGHQATLFQQGLEPLMLVLLDIPAWYNS